MFRETLFFKTALYSAYDWLAKIRQPIFCRVPSALQPISVSAFQNRSRGKSCVVERGAPGMNPSVISLCEMPLPLFVAWRRQKGERAVAVGD